MYSFNRALSPRSSSIPAHNKSRFGQLLVVALMMSRILVTTGCTEGASGDGVYNGDDDTGTSDGSPNGGTDGSSDGGTDGSSTWEGEAYRYDYVVESYSEAGLDRSYGISVDSQGSMIGCFSSDSDVDSDQTISDSDMQLVWGAIKTVTEGVSSEYYACHSHCKDYPIVYSAGIGVGDDPTNTMRYFGWEQGSYAPHALWDLGTLSESLITKYCGSTF